MIGQCSLPLQEYNGMTVNGTFSKKVRYYGNERLHLAYSVENPDASLEAGPFLPWNKADLKPGDLLEPDFHSNYGERKKVSFIYLTAILSPPPAAAGSGRSV